MGGIRNMINGLSVGTNESNLVERHASRVGNGHGRRSEALTQGNVQMADEVNATAFRIRGCENLRPQGRIVGVSRVRQDTDLGPQAVLLDLHQGRIHSISGGARHQANHTLYCWCPCAYPLHGETVTNLCGGVNRTSWQLSKAHSAERHESQEGHHDFGYVTIPRASLRLPSKRMSAARHEGLSSKTMPCRPTACAAATLARTSSIKTHVCA